MEKLDEGFFDQYTDDFLDYFERHKILNVMHQKEYKKINQQICKLKEKYPNTITFLEDKENVELSYEEEKIVNEILKLQDELNIIELKESFKLGFKEAYIYFESMNMLNI